MGILSRFGDIMSANINNLLDKFEDPEKMVDQYMRNAMEDLAEVKKETAGIMAEERRCKRELEECDADIQKYTGLAMKAVNAGNDGDARTFLAKKQELEASRVALQQAYQVSTANAQKMRDLHNKLTNDVATLKARRANVKSQMAVARTQEKINDAMSASDKVTGAMGAFARMEEKAQRKLDEAAAMADLNDMSDVGADLRSAESRYSGVNSTSVDDELARLKAAMNPTAGLDGYDNV